MQNDAWKWGGTIFKRQGSVTMYFNEIQTGAHLDDAAAADAWLSVWAPLYLGFPRDIIAYLLSVGLNHKEEPILTKV